MRVLGQRLAPCVEYRSEAKDISNNNRYVGVGRLGLIA